MLSYQILVRHLHKPRIQLRPTSSLCASMVNDGPVSVPSLRPSLSRDFRLQRFLFFLLQRHFSTQAINRFSKHQLVHVFSFIYKFCEECAFGFTLQAGNLQSAAVHFELQPALNVPRSVSTIEPPRYNDRAISTA